MSLIIHPPRAFTVVLQLQFDDDTRDDATLQADVMQSITLALSIAGNVKKVGVVPTPPEPPQGIT